MICQCPRCIKCNGVAKSKRVVLKDWEGKGKEQWNEKHYEYFYMSDVSCQAASYSAGPGHKQTNNTCSIITCTCTFDTCINHYFLFDSCFPWNACICIGTSGTKITSMQKRGKNDHKCRRNTQPQKSTLMIFSYAWKLLAAVGINTYSLNENKCYFQLPAQHSDMGSSL